MLSLTDLDLSHNSINNLTRLVFGTLDGVGTHLSALNLSGNKITSVWEPAAFLYMTALSFLDLSFNRIDDMVPQALSRLNSLESLLLNHNKLTRVPFEALQVCFYECF